MVLEPPKNLFAQIAVDVPLRTAFTYQIPEALEKEMRPGSRILVPFGKKKVVGVCLKTDADLMRLVGADAKSLPENLKMAFHVLDDAPLFDETYLNWLKFAADYYCAPIGQVLAGAMPAALTQETEKPTKKSRVKSLIPESTVEKALVILTPTQKKIVDAILSQAHEFHPALIFGVTGSGKTEVYIEVIKSVLSRGKSALFLVPEIGLTPQMIERLSRHFRDSLLLYHSGLTPKQKMTQWQLAFDAGSKNPKVMVGTRSALFSPLKNLGVIIVDEEHDTSYKQEDRFRYHARDLAVARAHGLAIPVLLGSATPSLESYHQVKAGKYHFYELKDRAHEQKLPQIRILDFAKEKEQTGSLLLVSQTIHDAIDFHHQHGEQIMIFVGQRGYAQNAYCVSCRTLQICPNCSVGLKYHKSERNLKCHYCEFSHVFDEICLKCAQKALTLLGFGTQSVEEEIRHLHAKLKIQRLDSDSVTPIQFAKALEDFSQGKTDLLIGTQMIAKGHDFPNVGFVGVLAIDAHLGLPDFRAGERAFQSLVQVAGRSGRSEKQGRVIVQSLMPNHYSLSLGAEQNYPAMAERELKEREMLNYPPFARLVQLRFLSNHENQLHDFFKNWQPFLSGLKNASSANGVEVLGPSEMPLSKIRGKYRHHILLKIKKSIKIRSVLDYILMDFEKQKTSGIQLQVDVDPMNLM